MNPDERGRVLFVCDRPVTDPAVASVAAELGYDVLRVRSADDALAYAAPAGFALILAGFSGGIETFAATVRRLRALFPPTPLVAIGLPPARGFTVEPIYEAGAIAALDDPISPPVLKAKARFYLDAYATAAERKRTQAALEEAHARLEAVMRAADVALWTWDVDGDTVGADARAGELFGLSAAEARSAPRAAYFGRIHPDDFPAAEAAMRGSAASGVPFEATFRVRAASGGWRWVLSRGQLERLEAGGRRMRGVVIDVTVQKEAEARLQASEERYRGLFDSIEDGVCVLEVLFDDAGQPCDLRLLEVNDAVRRHLGWQEAAGKTLSMLAQGRHGPWVETCARVIASGEAARFVNEAPSVGRWFDFHLARVGPAGSRLVVALFEDITERRRNELELRRLADDLAEQDRRKTEFLATLAHELRNPMAPLRSGLQFMRRAKGDPGAVARVQDIMDRQLDQLVHLVDDLLDVARITRGQVELKPGWIDLAEVLRAAVDTSMPLIDVARHHLDLRLPPEPLTLYADPTRLTQVVSNLLNNAAKYTPRGGAIVLAAERDGDQAVIVVSDNGIGIPSESLEEVFRMFTQVSRTAQHMGAGGLGIGLSLVRSLVELHGGSITAASGGLDAGSVFTVRLPLAREGAPPRPRPAASPAQAPAPGLRLLVVDDNRDAGDTLAALLGMMGHSAPVAADGYQALRMVAGLHPQVVFLDLGMPGLSGYEVAQQIRKDPQLDDVRLVALTGWGGEADRARSRAAGFDAHLTKPATVAAIEAVLAELGSPVQG